MKKKLLTILTLCLMAICVVFGVGCKDTSSDDENKGTAYRIVVTGDSTLECFSEGQLSASVYKNEVQTSEKVQFISEDESFLKIDENGKMFALNKAGTVDVVARLECGETETFNIVIVNNGNIPHFTSGAKDKGKINILEGMSSNLGIEFTYLGKEVADATFTYQLDTNEYITLNEMTGVIETKAIGSTVVSATASWRGYTETIEIEVNVCEDINVEIDGSGLQTNVDGTKSVKLYTYDGQIDGITYKDELQLTCNANGATGEVKQWYTTNESVVTVNEHGLVKVVGIGEAKVYFTYATANFEYDSLSLTVSVEFPLIERKNSAYFVDVYETKDLTEVAISATSVFASEVKVDEVYIGTKKVSIENAKMDLSGFDLGEYIATFVSSEAKYSVKVPFYLATKVITTAEELKNMYSFDPNYALVETGDTFYSYDGYFVLGDDIDCTDVTFSAKCATAVQTGLEITYTVAGNGFKGTFNGRGYSIKNASFWTGGLFGEVSNGAVIKNVRFDNATILFGWGVTNGILGQNIAAATVENCYFDVAFVVHPSAVGSSSGSSVLAGWTYFGAQIKDCVINMRENATNAPLIRNESGSWNGVQGPYLAENVLIIYQTNDKGVYSHGGVGTICVNNFVNKTEINLQKEEASKFLVAEGANFTSSTDDETVLSIEGYSIIPLKEGTANVWLQYTIGDYTFRTEKVEITVVNREVLESEFEIRTIEELQAISEELGTYKLMTDLTIENNSDAAIISSLDCTLDLNGYTITYTTANATLYPLIGTLNGTIKNGKIVATSTLNSKYSGGTLAIGGGEINNGVIENVEIVITFAGTTDYNVTWTDAFGAKLTFKNVVIKASNTSNNPQTGLFTFGNVGTTTITASTSFENTIIIATNVPLGTWQSWGVLELSFANMPTQTNSAMYDSVDAYKAAEYDTSSFLTEIWTINAETGLPEIKLNTED